MQSFEEPENFYEVVDFIREMCDKGKCDGGGKIAKWLMGAVGARERERERKRTTGGGT